MTSKKSKSRRKKEHPGKSIDKWDERFLEIAREAQLWSKDPDGKVGAVIANRRRSISAVSCNGFPVAVEDTMDRLSNKKLKLEMVIHAEQNAVITAGINVRAGTIYVVGKPVCARCAGILIQAGVERVVAKAPPEKDIGEPDRWNESGRISLAMFEEADVLFVPIPDELADKLKLRDLPEKAETKS